MSWETKFPAPIGMPKGQPLVTLRDAATYITGLPKKKQDETAWQTAIHCLIQAADHGGPLEFARLGMAQALHPTVPVYDTSRKDPVFRNSRKLARDR